MRRNVRRSKYDPLVDEVELIDCNPMYAHVRLQDGRETTVSLHQLAPVGDLSNHSNPGPPPSSQTVNLESNDSLIRLPPIDLSNQSVENISDNVSVKNLSIAPPDTFVDQTFSEPSQLETSIVSSDDKHSDNKSKPFVRTRPYCLRNREA